MKEWTISEIERGLKDINDEIAAWNVKWKDSEFDMTTYQLSGPGSRKRAIEDELDRRKFNREYERVY
jgi:hypothetical protein